MPTSPTAPGPLGSRRGLVLAITGTGAGSGATTLAGSLALAMAARGLDLGLIDAGRSALRRTWLGPQGCALVPHLMPLADLAAAPSWLAELADRTAGCDTTIVDLPAGDVTAFAAAALVAHVLVVTVKPDDVATARTARLLTRLGAATVERAVCGGSAGPTVLVVPARVDRRCHESGRWRGLYAGFGPKLERAGVTGGIGPALREDATLAAALAARRWVGEIRSAGPACADVMVLEATANEMLRRAAASPILDVLRRRAPAKPAPVVTLHPRVAVRPPSPEPSAWWQRLLAAR